MMHLPANTFASFVLPPRAQPNSAESALFTSPLPSTTAATLSMDPATAASAAAPAAMSTQSNIAPQPSASPLAPAPLAVQPPHPSHHPPQRSPKRVRLSPAQKQAVCDLLAGGARPDYIVDTFGIAKRTVFKIQRAQRLRRAELAGNSAASNAEKPRQQPASAAAQSSSTSVQLGVDAQLAASLGAGSSGMSTDALMTGSNEGADQSGIQPAAVGASGSSSSLGLATAAVTNPAGATGCTMSNPGMKKCSPPAKRVRLNVAEKLEICNFVQRGGTPNAVISKYGISRRTFFKILRDEQCIRQTVDRDHVSAETKSIRPPHFPLLDQALSAFVLSARAARVPLNWHMVRQQALLLRSELLTSGKERPERIPHLERFTASEHWCQLFMRKNANKKLPASLDDPVQPARRHAMKETKQLHTQLMGFNADNVYTLVAPRLYYRHIPQRFFNDRGTAEYKQEPVNIGSNDTVDPRSMNDTSEPFITLLIAANVMGTKRLPVTMIVPCALQKAFETRKPAIPYICRSNQRCDGPVMRQWLVGSFVPFITANNGCKVALMMDEALSIGPGLIEPAQTVQHVTLVPVPRLSVCMQETAKNGIFPLLVARYRFKLFEIYSALVSLRDQLRKHAEVLLPAHLGLAEGHDATVFDAADLIRESWDEIHSERIARSWWRVHVLPDAIAGQLESMYGRKTNDVDIINDVAGFVLAIVRMNPFGKEGLASIANGKRWISVLEVIRWFTFEYEMLPKQADLPANGVDWASTTASAVGGDVQPEDVNLEINRNAAGPAAEACAGSEEVRKWSPNEFAQVMKHYADLERCIVATRDAEALRNLRDAKKASLAHFVLNGTSIEGENGIN